MVVELFVAGVCTSILCATGIGPTLFTSDCVMRFSGSCRLRNGYGSDE